MEHFATKATTFTTVKEFSKQYDIVRTEILERHGYKKGDKVRLNKAMALMFSFDGENFINTGCYSIVDMKDKIRMYELFGTDGDNVLFKLRALV